MERLTQEARTNAAEYLEALAAQLGALTGCDPHEVAERTDFLEAHAERLALAGIRRLGVQPVDKCFLIFPETDAQALPLDFERTKRLVFQRASWLPRVDHDGRLWAFEFFTRQLKRVREREHGFLTEGDAAALRVWLPECPDAGRLRLICRHGGARALVSLEMLPDWIATAEALAATSALPHLYLRDVSLTADDSDAIGGAS